MIYDPRRRAIEFRQQLLDILTDAELADYALSKVGITGQECIRICDTCGSTRILQRCGPNGDAVVRCECGLGPLDPKDCEVLRGR